jgi:thioredoxin 2
MSETDRPASRIVPCPKCASLNRVPRDSGSGAQPKCGKCHAPLDATSTVFDVGTAALRKIVLNSPIPVLVDFWAPWCGPCVSFAPTFKHFSQNYGGQILHLKLDTEANADAGAAFNIRGIPTLILFQDEKEKARQSGAMPLPTLTQWVKEHVPTLA